MATPHGPKSVSELSRGDEVMIAAGTGDTTTVATVACVVVTPCTDGVAFFVEFPGGLAITPYHPVRVNGRWQHPQDAYAVVERTCDAVYNLVLDAGHVVCVNGVECVTLGHGLDDGDGGVLRHPYLGTQSVINDLRACAGWASGRVHVQRMVRSAAGNGGGGLISGLVECGGSNTAC